MRQKSNSLTPTKADKGKQKAITADEDLPYYEQEGSWDDESVDYDSDSSDTSSLGSLDLHAFNPIPEDDREEDPDFIPPPLAPHGDDELSSPPSSPSLSPSLSPSPPPSRRGVGRPKKKRKKPSSSNGPQKKPASRQAKQPPK